MANRNDNQDEEFMKKLETASPEDAKKLVLNSIVPECRSIAGNFFDCVETKFKTIDPKASTNFEQVEKQLNESIVPDCMRQYDLESCLKKYENSNH